MSDYDNSLAKKWSEVRTIRNQQYLLQDQTCYKDYFTSYYKVRYNKIYFVKLQCIVANCGWVSKEVE